jgi:hypothetical protein
MSPSGMHWRCWIGPVILFYRNQGAILFEKAAAAPDDGEAQAAAMGLEVPNGGRTTEPG